MAAKVIVNSVQILSGHRQAVYAVVQFNHKIISAGGDGFIAMWNYPENNDAVLYANVQEPVYALGVYNQQLIAGGHSGSMYVFDSNASVRSIAAHTRGIYAFLQVEDKLISAGGDGRIALWDKEFQLMHSLAVSGKSVRSLVADEKFVFVGCSDGMMHCLDFDLNILHSWQAHERAVFGMSINASGNIVSGGLDAKLKIWSRQGDLLQSVDSHLLHVHAVVASPSKQWLSTGSMDKSLKIWNPETLELLKVIDKSKGNAHKSSVNAICWLNDDVLVTGSDDKELMVWKVQSQL